MYTRDQQYAQAVFVRVEQLKGKEWKDEYGSMAHKLPVLIRTAGLTQALAFLEAKGKDREALRTLRDHLVAVVAGGDLVARSREAPLSEYMQLTRQCLDALLWFKRYAQSVLDVTDASAEPGSDAGTTPPAPGGQP